MTDESITIIEAKPQTVARRLYALWTYRGFYPFVFNEIMAKKFRGTFLGIWWLVVRPLVATTGAILVFAYMIPVGSQGAPYPIFFLTGFAVWSAFQATVIFMPRTLLWMQGLMRRTYFPKLIVPAASLGPPLLEIAVTVFLLIVCCVYYGLVHGYALNWGPALLLYPVCVAFALAFGWAIGTVMSVVALFFRDVVFSVSYFVQLFMFLTPVIYPITAVPEKWRWVIYLLNPMAQIVDLSRWSLLGVGEVNASLVAYAAGAILLTVVGAIAFFLRAESILADEM